MEISTKSRWSISSPKTPFFSKTKVLCFVRCRYWEGVVRVCVLAQGYGGNRHMINLTEIHADNGPEEERPWLWLETSFDYGLDAYTVRSISCGWRVSPSRCQKVLFILKDEPEICFGWSLTHTHTLMIGILSSKLINRRFEGYFTFEHMNAIWLALGFLRLFLLFARSVYPNPINGQYIHNVLEVAWADLLSPFCRVWSRRVACQDSSGRFRQQPRVLPFLFPFSDSVVCLSVIRPPCSLLRKIQFKFCCPMANWHR